MQHPSDHSSLTSSVRISVQTASISRYSINGLVFITETENAYCAVRGERLNAVNVILSLYSSFYTLKVGTCCFVHDLDKLA
jgi:hypothetical protein